MTPSDPADDAQILDQHELDLASDNEFLDEAARICSWLKDRGITILLSADSDDEADDPELSPTERRAAERNLLMALCIATNTLHYRHKSRDATPQQAEALIAKLRFTVIQALWLQNWWVEPWVSLINQELPGADTTSADIDRFIESGAESVARIEQSKSQMYELEATLRVRAEQAERHWTRSDELILKLMVNRISLRYDLPQAATDLAPHHRSELLHSVQQTFGPDETFWTSVIRDYYPA